MIRRYEVLELGDYSRRIGEDNVKFVLETFDCPLYLISQIGKNFAVAESERIFGRELVELALDKLRKAQRLVGGKLVLVERETDRPKLFDFYNTCGFKSWNERYDKGDAIRYDQMIRVLESVA